MRTIEEIRQLLLELSACTGVSGDEGGIAKKIEELLRPAADCRRTPLGNVIAVQNAGAPKADDCRPHGRSGLSGDPY